MLNPLVNMYGRLDWYFEIISYLGKASRGTNGVMQGCSMSVLMLSPLMGQDTIAGEPEHCR